MSDQRVMRNCQGAHYGSTVASDCLQKPAKKLIGRSLLCRELLRSRVQSDRLLLQKVAVWGWLSKATLLFEKHPDAQKRRTLGGGALRPPFVMLVRSSSARAPSHEHEQPKSAGVGRYTSARGCRSRGRARWLGMLENNAGTEYTSPPSHLRIVGPDAQPRLDGLHHTSRWCVPCLSVAADAS